MRRDPQAEGRRWLDQSREDLISAEILLREGRHYMVCFVAQQVGEKAVKAFLYATGEQAVLGHSVEELCRRAAPKAAELAALREEAAELDAFYVPARYPNGLPENIPARVFGRKSAERAIEVARRVVQAVESAWPRT